VHTPLIGIKLCELVEDGFQTAEYAVCRFSFRIQQFMVDSGISFFSSDLAALK